MRRERCQPTRREWEKITSSRPGGEACHEGRPSLLPL
jgi:hypothetical protein